MAKKTEIIAIGNELISGDVVDTNSAYISQELLKLGMETSFHSSIGDVKEDIKNAIQTALTRSDLIFITGGLGPTDDDITAQIVSEALNREFVLDEKIWEHIQATITKMNRPIDSFNKKQAYIPQGAKYFLNYSGTAPCIFIEENHKKIFLLPGVPSEVKYFIQNDIKPYLNSKIKNSIKVKKIKLSGIAEAKVNEVIKDIVDKNEATIAFLPKSSELILKITAQSTEESISNKIIDKTSNEIILRLKEYVFGFDDDSIEVIIKKLLTEKKKTVSVAESCTGGLISKILTDVSGSSEYISMNVTTYSNEAKMELLEVKEKTLEQYGAVSEQTAQEMAEGIKRLSQSDFGLSITGIAGPTGGSEEKPVGLVFVGITDGKNTQIEKFLFPPKLPRTEIRTRAAHKALHLLKDFINNSST
jgi:nicotinamide-nucleotide amidase